MMIHLLDWPTLITTLTSAIIIGVGGLLVRGITKLNDKLELITKHSYDIKEIKADVAELKRDSEIHSLRLDAFERPQSTVHSPR